MSARLGRAPFFFSSLAWDIIFGYIYSDDAETDGRWGRRIVADVGVKYEQTQENHKDVLGTNHQLGIELAGKWLYYPEPISATSRWAYFIYFLFIYAHTRRHDRPFTTYVFFFCSNYFFMRFFVWLSPFYLKNTFPEINKIVRSKRLLVEKPIDCNTRK